MNWRRYIKCTLKREQAIAWMWLITVLVVSLTLGVPWWAWALASLCALSLGLEVYAEYLRVELEELRAAAVFPAGESKPAQDTNEGAAP